jgi:hypothetical protein
VTDEPLVPRRVLDRAIKNSDQGRNVGLAAIPARQSLAEINGAGAANTFPAGFAGTDCGAAGVVKAIHGRF